MRGSGFSMKRVLGRGVVLLAVAFALGAAGWRWREYRLGEQLVADAAALVRERSRPVHRLPALEGTFEACVARTLEHAPDAGALWHGADAAKVTAVARMEAPRSTLTAEQEAAVADWLQWWETARPCLRAGATGQVPGLGPLAGWREPLFKTWKEASIPAGRTVALAVQAASAEGRHADALAHCADGLAFARDVSLNQGLIGTMTAVSLSSTLFRACASSVAQAPRVARLGFAAEVEVVSRGVQPFSRVLEMESTQMRVAQFSNFMAPYHRASLPPDAEAFAQGVGFDKEDSSPQALLLRATWPGYEEYLPQVIAAARDADPQTALRLAAQRKPGALRLLQELAGGSPASPDDPWADFAERARGLDHVLTSLTAVARAGPPTVLPPGATTEPADGGLLFHLRDEPRDAGFEVFVPTTPGPRD